MHLRLYLSIADTVKDFCSSFIVENWLESSNNLYESTFARLSGGTFSSAFLIGTKRLTKTNINVNIRLNNIGVIFRCIIQLRNKIKNLC